MRYQGETLSNREPASFLTSLLNVDIDIASYSLFQGDVIFLLSLRFGTCGQYLEPATYEVVTLCNHMPQGMVKKHAAIK